MESNFDLSLLYSIKQQAAQDRTAGPGRTPYNCSPLWPKPSLL